MNVFKKNWIIKPESVYIEICVYDPPPMFVWLCVASQRYAITVSNISTLCFFPPSSSSSSSSSFSFDSSFNKSNRKKIRFIIHNRLGIFYVHIDIIQHIFRSYPSHFNAPKMRLFLSTHEN